MRTDVVKTWMILTAVSNW